MKTKITHGKRIGIIILVGEKMGYDILFKEQAVLLYQNDSISPIYMGSIEEHSCLINNLIAKDGRTEEANRIVTLLLNKKE